MRSSLRAAVQVSTQAAILTTLAERFVELLLGKVKAAQKAPGVVRQSEFGHLLFQTCFVACDQCLLIF